MLHLSIGRNSKIIKNNGGIQYFSLYHDSYSYSGICVFIFCKSRLRQIYQRQMGLDDQQQFGLGAYGSAGMFVNDSILVGK